jgi:hypothetical protein
VSVSDSIVDRYGFFQFAIFDCAIPAAVAGIHAQLDEWSHRPYRTELGYLDVRRIMLSPHGPHTLPSVCKGIILAEVSGKGRLQTLFVSSVADGAHSLLHCVSRRISGGISGFRAESLRRRYPASKVFRIEQFETVRFVRAMKGDTRWEFFEKGPPLWFEDVEHYKSRNVKDRLNPEVIAEYLARVGVASLEVGFWTDSSKAANYIFEEGFSPGVA